MQDEEAYVTAPEVIDKMQDWVTYAAEMSKIYLLAVA
jgi:hypothetical protein